MFLCNLWLRRRFQEWTAKKWMENKTICEQELLRCHVSYELCSNYLFSVLTQCHEILSLWAADSEDFVMS